MSSYVICIMLALQYLPYGSTTQRTIGADGVQYKFFDSKYNLIDGREDLKISDNKSLIVFAHGFRCSTRTGLVADFGKSLARLTDSNVALVDWSNWTEKLEYTDAVLQLPTVAPYVVDWLKGLEKRGVVKSFDNVTLIGHSLGAQLIGYVGHRLNGMVRRIIALDPAQPNFVSSQKNERVDVKSGQFVMVLHTSTLFLGMREPVGHVDFYFNGGEFQPACILDTLCGHIYAVKYFIESLEKPDTFTAFRCSTLRDCENKTVDEKEKPIKMNTDLPISTRGLYSIKTEKKEMNVIKFYNNLPKDN